METDREKIKIIYFQSLISKKNKKHRDCNLKNTDFVQLYYMYKFNLSEKKQYRDNLQNNKTVVFISRLRFSI